MRGNSFGSQQKAKIKNGAATDPNAILAWSLMTELMSTVPTFGSRQVHVGFSGSGAYVNFQLGYVNLPSLPPGLRIPVRICQELRGFAGHEAAHLLFTDHAVLEHGRSDSEKKDALLHSVWNAIEDYFIEANMLELYPGMHRNFTATEERCCREYLAAVTSDPDRIKDLRVIAPVALTWARAIYFGLKTTASQDSMATLPQGLQQRVWDWFDRMIDVASTQECLDLARAITAEIRQDPFDPQDPPSAAYQQQHPAQGTGQGQGAGQGAGQGQGQGAGQGQGRGQGQTQGQTQGQGQSAGQGQDQGHGSGSGQGAFGGSLAAPQASDPQPLSPDRNLQGALDELDTGGQTAPDHTSFAVTSDHERGPHQSILTDPEGSQGYRAAELRVAGTTGAVSRSIKRALVAISRARIKGGRTDGMLDDRRLAQVVLGTPEIYKKRQEGEKIDTAVEIVIDCSGSMNRVLPLCQELAVVFHNAFAGTPIAYEILGYTSASGEDMPDAAQVMAAAIDAQAQASGNPPEHSVRAIASYVFKAFDAPYHVAATTLGNMTSAPLGGTPTAEAILIAYERLRKRPERRKVMMVLSDGEPDCGGQLVAANVRALEAANVTMFGLGIGSTAMKRQFTNFASINEARDLAATVLSKLVDILLKDRRKTCTGRPSPASGIVHA